MRIYIDTINHTQRVHESDRRCRAWHACDTVASDAEPKTQWECEAQ